MIVDPDEGGLTPFEALHLYRAAAVVLHQAPDAVLASAAQKVLQSNGEYLDRHPEVIPQVEDLIRITQELRVPHE